MRQRVFRQNPDELVVVSHGMLSYGFPEASVDLAIKANVDLIAVDAGSTDPGPYYLGSGELFGNREMVHRDLALLLEVQEATGAKIVVGSSGGAGTDSQVEETVEILSQEISRRGWNRKVAVIRSQVTKDELRQSLAGNLIRSFETGTQLTEQDIEQATNVVAQIGVDPIISALKDDPDIVICGRAWDPANIAALPILLGCDPGLSIHAGKILECGSLAVSPPQGADLIIGRIRQREFIIEPCNEGQRCTIESVAAHTFYEKTDPLHLPGPGGWSDLRETTFEQLDERSVRVAGSRFVQDPTHVVKLEGARFAGWRCVLMSGIRDPIMIGQIDSIQLASLERLSSLLKPRVTTDQYKVVFHRYGLDGVMGRLEPVRAVPHEIGLMIEVVGVTQEIASTVMATLRSLLLHWSYPGRIATAGNLALPFSPAEFSAGPVYEFNIYHLMEIPDPVARFGHEIRWVS